jgi:hypothetical protein
MKYENDYCVKILIRLSIEANTCNPSYSKGENEKDCQHQKFQVIPGSS